MAGFAFAFEFSSQTRELAIRLLRRAQRQARHYGLELRYRRDRGDQTYLVTVDGPLKGMQTFAARLSVEAPIAAAFAERPGPEWVRTDVAEDLVHGYLEGMEEITSIVLRMHRTLRPAVPKGAVAPVPSLRFDFTDIPQDILPPLRRFESSIAVYANMPIMLLPMLPVEEEHVLEEAHTATGLLMRRALKVRNKSYAQMVNVALARGYVDTHQHHLLMELKDLRRGVKHRGKTVRPERGYELIINAVNCCHQLLARIAGREW